MPLLIALLLLVAPAGAQPVGAVALAPGQARLEGDAIGTFRGIVVDARDGEGLAGVPLKLVRPSPAASRSWPEPWTPEAWNEAEDLLSVVSASDGSFRFDGLPGGSYRVRSDDRWLPRRGVDGYVAPGESITRRLELETGARLRGRVQDEAGRPVAQLPVLLAGLDRGDGQNAGRGRAASKPTRSAEDGSFELRWIPPGTAWVQAGHRDLGFSSPLALPLEEGARVEGVVLIVPDERDRLANKDSDGGVGIRLDFTERGPVLAGVVEGLPAALAGLQQGDLIASIDGHGTLFMTSPEFINRCRGRTGTTVELTYVRGASGPVDVSLVREPLPRPDRR